MSARVLGGALLREAGRWRWRDGTPEPRVRDYGLRDRYGSELGARPGFVEVPTRLVRREPLLAWVDVGLRSRAFRLGCLGGRRGRSRAAVLVPELAWRTEGARVIGAQWAESDRAEILARAEELGWTPGSVEQPTTFALVERSGTRP